MIVDSLIAIRDALRANRTLTDYLVSHYRNPCTYAIGKSIPSTATQYPWIAVTLVNEVRKENRVHRAQTVVIAWFISSDAQEDGVYAGMVESAQIGEIILQSIENLRVSLPQGRAMSVRSEMDTFTDMYSSFPFYSSELQATVHITD